MNRGIDYWNTGQTLLPIYTYANQCYQHTHNNVHNRRYFCNQHNQYIFSPLWHDSNCWAYEHRSTYNNQQHRQYSLCIQRYFQYLILIKSYLGMVYSMQDALFFLVPFLFIASQFHILLHLDRLIQQPMFHLYRLLLMFLEQFYLLFFFTSINMLHDTTYAHFST